MTKQIARPTIVHREPMDVVYVETGDDFSSLPRAWTELESRFESLRGRHFFGAFWAEDGVYRACAQLRPGEDADPLGLPQLTLPGGTFRRLRLRGEPPAIYEEIGPAFDQLVALGGLDPTRPSLEHYRRRDEIDVLLPIVSS